ncbi:CASP-like protein 5B2 isoform X3 [Nicotiana tomentosiformis]|uniref:CASP-like protein 5B2 isoform X3 n=1 Tax=Nicotiana tomentosiformis TaxID=4098 RepID=UPI001444BF2C|nr:CASP-like protein 5B2 isoform X3 [Nicotiana tomentosiformis]
MDSMKLWGEALAAATGFMLLIGLLCCCLSYKMSCHGNKTKGSSGFSTCDGGFGGEICAKLNFKGRNVQFIQKKIKSEETYNKARPRWTVSQEPDCTTIKMSTKLRHYCGSIGVMVSASGFSNYTAFCYLIASMGLQVLWSFGLACLDIYALRIKRDLQNPVLVTATLSLAAACSSAGIAVLYSKDLNFCSSPPHLPCGRFELSVVLAFITWFLIAISSHVMFWILAAV